MFLVSLVCFCKLLREENSGPRHLWFHPRSHFAYGSDEQGHSATVYGFNPSKGTLKKGQPITSMPDEKFDGRHSTSDIEVHPSGKFVYLTNHGYKYSLFPAVFSLVTSSPTPYSEDCHD